MKFVLLIISDEKVEAGRARSDVDRIVAGHRAVTAELRAAGKLVAGSRLRFSTEAATVRLRHGEPVVSDGPFAEAKEVVGGFYVIEAASKEDAVRWAKKLPLSDTGAIEVRPVWEMGAD
jgi:hypothetical protein